jgi:hypothetical protein
MTKWFTRMTMVLATAAFSASIATALPDKDKKAAAAPKCPACKMELSTKKDKTHTVATKVKGKTYYCCADCPMGAKKKK